MKKMMILMLMSGTAFAQPVYNFNFYNGNSGAAAPTLNGAPMQAPVAPVQGPVVQQIVKEREEKKESIIGFQFGTGLMGYSDDMEASEQLMAGVVFNLSKTAHLRLSYVHDKYDDAYSGSYSLNGINVGLGTHAALVGPLGFVTELEGQYSKGSSITSKYVGLKVGPQLDLGNLQLNLVGRVGYQQNDYEGHAGENFDESEYYSIDGLNYGVQLNIGFKM